MKELQVADILGIDKAGHIFFYVILSSLQCLNFCDIYLFRHIHDNYLTFLFNLKNSPIIYGMLKFKINDHRIRSKTEFSGHI